MTDRKTDKIAKAYGMTAEEFAGYRYAARKHLDARLMRREEIRKRKPTRRK